MKVLIVDDCWGTRTTMQGLFSKHGHTSRVTDPLPKTDDVGWADVVVFDLGEDHDTCDTIRYFLAAFPDKPAVIRTACDPREFVGSHATVIGKHIPSNALVEYARQAFDNARKRHAATKSIVDRVSSLIDGISPTNGQAVHV